MIETVLMAMVVTGAARIVVAIAQAMAAADMQNLWNPKDTLGRRPAPKAPAEGGL